MKNLLSQNEIDALLEAFGDKETAAAQPREGVELYDLFVDSAQSQQRPSLFSQLNRRFTEHLREGLQGLLGCELNVRTLGVESSSAGDYLHSLYVPTSVTTLAMPPLSGTALMVLDSPLVYRLVEVFFGGAGIASAEHLTDFSTVERRLIDRMLGLASASFQCAAHRALALECQILASERDPSLISFARPHEKVVVCRYDIDLAGVGGEFHLVFHEQLRGSLDDALQRSDEVHSGGDNPQWKQALTQAMMGVCLSPRFVVAEKTLTLAELATLRVGDVLPLSGARSSLRVGDETVFDLTLDNVAGSAPVQLQFRIR